MTLDIGCVYRAGRDGLARRRDFSGADSDAGLRDVEDLLRWGTTHQDCAKCDGPIADNPLLLLRRWPRLGELTLLEAAASWHEVQVFEYLLSRGAAWAVRTIAADDPQDRLGTSQAEGGIAVQLVADGRAEHLAVLAREIGPVALVGRDENGCNAMDLAIIGESAGCAMILLEHVPHLLDEAGLIGVAPRRRLANMMARGEALEIGNLVRSWEAARAAREFLDGDTRESGCSP